MKKMIGIILCLSILFGCFSSVTIAEPAFEIGDVNGDQNIDAKDALAVLKNAVGKQEFSVAQKVAADVDLSNKIDAVDALMILQYSVGKRSLFPASATPEEQYYMSMDEQYGLSSSDFTKATEIENLSDTKELVEKFGKVADASDVETYDCDKNGRLIYDRISRELNTQKNIMKYQAEQKKTVTLQQDGVTAKFTVPTNMTAYDAVPIEYEVYQQSASGQVVYLEATAFEEANRCGNNNYFDLNIPGNVALEVTYDGYVHATTDFTKTPAWSTDVTSDKQGVQYPNYTPSDLILSSEIKADKYNWFKFTFKNVGNTILDSEGSGAFCWKPILYKNVGGSWIEQCTEVNYNEKLYDYLYPGESEEVWIYFGGLGSGEYKVTLYGEVRNEQLVEDWAANYVGGRRLMQADFTFTANDAPNIVKPQNQTVICKNDSISRNNWLGVYEEFMSSFVTLSGISTNASKPTTGVMFVQPATFTENVTLHLTVSNHKKQAAERVPVNVETDSLNITFNPYNQNYTVKDGKKVPLLATQAMQDMRVNDQISPYPAGGIVNDFLDMQEAGINFWNSTMGFSYQRVRATGGWEANKFLMDVVRAFGLAFEGIGAYPYNSPETVKYATGIGANLKNTPENGYGLKDVNTAVGSMAAYSFRRYGDTYHTDANGITAVGVEDTRGWMTIDHDVRLDILSDDIIAKYQEYLKEAYGTIGNLNKKYGMNFGSFQEVDPREWGTYMEGMKGYNYTSMSIDGYDFADWTDSSKQLDIFRTKTRIEDYKEMLNTYSKLSGETNAKVWISLEGSPWGASGIRETTNNLHYRYAYYEQYRQAAIPEMLAASDVVYGIRNYSSVPYTASECYALTSRSVNNGVNVCRLFCMPHGIDYAANKGGHGTYKYNYNLNLKSEDIRTVRVDTMAALFPMMKAVYEGGGIPGVLWSDYYCEGFVTSTQFKELKFYTEKINEMLSEGEAKDWSENATPNTNNNDYIVGAWSYPEEYIRGIIAGTKRNCRFIRNVK